MSRFNSLYRRLFTRTVGTNIVHYQNIYSGNKILKECDKRVVFFPKRTIATENRIWKGELKMMKIQSPILEKIITPEIRKLVNLFEKNNYEIRIAGGAVRDLLMDKIPHDIDFATTATPDQMKEMFELEGVRMINMNGEKHGTITARIDDKENFEVTTLRIDVVTDGRRAKVEYTTDWRIDANRRDLTINAMFLDFDGTLYDYFNGKEDLQERRIRFVGSPEERIHEDYLRIMRYFRFYGRIADHPYQHEEGILDCIKTNAYGLENVAGERLWMELQQIIKGRFASGIMKAMVNCGVMKRMGFPECDTMEYERVCLATEGLEFHHMTRMAALLTEEEQLYDVDKRIKFSNEEFALALFILQHRGTEMGENKLKFCQYLYTDSPSKNINQKMCELLKYKSEKDTLAEFEAWDPPAFPISGSDLTEKNIPRSPHFKMALDELRQMWKLSDFTLTQEELIERIDEVYEKVKTLPKKREPKPKRRR